MAGGEINANSIRLRIYSNGLMGDSAGSAAVRNANGLAFADRIGVWMSATDSAGNIRLACHDILGSSHEFWAGPLSLNNMQSADSNVWNRVYPMSSALINSHLMNYKNNGYVPHPFIVNWPGNGSSGYATILAPFVDNEVNDQVYTPLDGDYPYIPTNSEILAIANDRANAHQLSGSLPMGVELHTSVMGFDSKDSALKNCLLVKYYVFNRSPFNYSNFRLSVAMNFGIGSINNEYLGTDVPNKTLFAINDTSEATFSNKLVSIGCMALNNRLSSTIYFENTGDPVNGKPVSDTQFLRLMKGYWKNGKRLVYGGNGVDASGNVTSFVYPYNTDASQGGQMWSDNDNFQSGKRYGLLNFDSAELKAGTARVYEVAIFLVEENIFNVKQIGQNCLTIRQALKTKNLLKIDQNDYTFVEKMSLYPNPVKAGEKMVINGAQEMPISMRVISFDGREICKINLEDYANFIILPYDFSDGVYLLEYETLNTKRYIKFVINH